MKYLIKELLGEFDRIGGRGFINPTIIAELGRLNLAILDVEAIKELLRPIPRVEVTPVILEKPVYNIVHLEKGVAVNTESVKFAAEKHIQVITAEKPIPINTQVPF